MLPGVLGPFYEAWKTKKYTVGGLDPYVQIREGWTEFLDPILAVQRRVSVRTWETYWGNADVSFFVVLATMRSVWLCCLIYFP